MITYSSASIYIESQTSLNSKITAIDAIISALLTTAATAASNEHITEYQLDDGQVKIRTSYRGAQAVFASIKAFEELKQFYVNKKTGRVVRLVDSKNFKHRN